METIFLKIAGFIIRINFNPTENIYFKRSLKRQILSIYKCFQINASSQKSDYTISIYDEEHRIILTKKQDHHEYITSFIEYLKENEIKTYYYISPSMFVHILNQLIIKLLAKHQGFILHASASNINGKAYIFCGPSGAGKSTAMKLLARLYPSLADDRIIIRKIKKYFYFYQSTHFAKNTWIKRGYKQYSIGAIFFLKKAKFLQAKRINDKNKIINLLSKQLLTNKEYLHQNMKCLLEFIKSFNEIYTLHFINDQKQITHYFSQLKI